MPEPRVAAESEVCLMHVLDRCVCVCVCDCNMRLASQAQLFHRQKRALEKYIADIHTVLKYEAVFGKVNVKLECRRTKNRTNVVF